MATNKGAVMVVEDDGEARAFLMQILELEGFTAVGFANGAEALDYLARSAVPRLIVMDIRMPVMDGRQFRSVLLQDPRLAKIPVIVVTALDPSAAAGMGALRVLRKPLDVNALIRIIKQRS